MKPTDSCKTALLKFFIVEFMGLWGFQFGIQLGWLIWSFWSIYQEEAEVNRHNPGYTFMECMFDIESEESKEYKRTHVETSKGWVKREEYERQR